MSRLEIAFPLALTRRQEPDSFKTSPHFNYKPPASPHPAARVRVIVFFISAPLTVPTCTPKAREGSDEIWGSAGDSRPTRTLPDSGRSWTTVQFAPLFAACINECLA